MRVRRARLQGRDLGPGARSDLVARIPLARGFDEHDPALLGGDRHVLDISRHDEEIALFHRDIAIPEAHDEPPAHHEERFFDAGMLVELEGARNARKAHLLTIDAARKMRLPGLRNAVE